MSILQGQEQMLMVYPGSVSLDAPRMLMPDGLDDPLPVSLNLSARDIELRGAGRPWVVNSQLLYPEEVRTSL